MKVLMFSSDKNIFSENSEARARMNEYADTLGELHIIGVAEKNPRIKPRINSRTLFLYPIAGAHRLTQLFYMFFCARSLYRSASFDVITIQAPDEIGCIAFLISRFFAIPLQVQIHTDIFSPWYRRASWKEWTRYRIARFLIPKADGIRVVSERIKHSLVQSKIVKQESRIFVLPIFIDTSRFLNAVSDGTHAERFKNYSFKIIAAGRFVDKEKNFGMLIDMMRDFVKICPDALLVIVGDGPDRKSYKLQTTSYKLGKNILIEPWCDNLPSLYKTFDLFLQPSNYEGWGRTVIEAMASGLPMLMTDVGLAGEVVKNGENGIVVSVGNRRAILEAVILLYQNPSLRMRLSDAGRKTAQLLAPAAKEEYLNAYKKALEQCLSAMA